MTLPTPDARSPRSMLRRSQILSSSHSMPAKPLTPPHAMSSPQTSSVHGPANRNYHEHAIDFATHSWDLATGGLKTLTAKRELPIRLERRTSRITPDMLATSYGYMFVLIIMVCVVLMLIGGGIVLLVMLQP